jgi:alkaline phosphatase D
MSNSRRRFVNSSAMLFAATAGQLAIPAAARAACAPDASTTPSAISRIEVEVWTGNGENDRTDDAADCRIIFQDGRTFKQGINNPNIDDRERGRRDRYKLNLTTAAAQAALSGQTVGSIKAVEIIKRNGTNGWRCVAVGLRVNNVVLLSRYVNQWLDTAGGSFVVTLRTDGGLDGLELLVKTANSHRADTDDAVYCNVVFADGSQLYANSNLLLNIGPEANDFERNNLYSTYAYLLPLPAGGAIDKKPSDIDGVYVRKEGSNGWLLQSARLYANGSKSVVVGNRAINQFLDSSMHVLKHRDWSSRSLMLPMGGSASTPLPANTQYRIIGPVLGHVGANIAKVLYRVEREDFYRVTLVQSMNPTISQSIDLFLCPTGTFTFSSLLPDTEYDFSFSRIVSGVPQAMPEGDGKLHTLPAEGQPVRFSFAFGSCARNGHDPDDLQPVWETMLQAASGADPIRFFVHLGDTTYFYDDTSEKNVDASALAAGQLASRKHLGFQRFARKVPCYAVWDDHDFRYNNSDSSGYTLKTTALKNFQEYWGNPDPLRAEYGLTTRFSYGNVDFYLMDGRFKRLPGAPVAPLFSAAQCNFIVQDIKNRGPNRLRVLMSGSLWNNTTSDNDQKKSAYGNAQYGPERQTFFTALSQLFGTHIQGLVFLSGDVHINQIYEVRLPANGNRVAPELVCSPLTVTSSGAKRPLDGERKWTGDHTEPGFAVVTIDTTASPWNLKVQFKRADGGLAFTQTYPLAASQFSFSSANSS